MIYALPQETKGKPNYASSGKQETRHRVWPHPPVGDGLIVLLAGNTTCEVDYLTTVLHVDVGRLFVVDCVLRNLERMHARYAEIRTFHGALAQALAAFDATPIAAAHFDFCGRLDGIHVEQALSAARSCRWMPHARLVVTAQKGRDVGPARITRSRWIRLFLGPSWCEQETFTYHSATVPMQVFVGEMNS